MDIVKKNILGYFLPTQLHHIPQPTWFSVIALLFIHGFFSLVLSLCTKLSFYEQLDGVDCLSRPRPKTSQDLNPPF